LHLNCPLGDACLRRLNGKSTRKYLENFIYTLNNFFAAFRRPLGHFEWTWAVADLADWRLLGSNFGPS